jgi:hypothetical protein
MRKAIALMLGVLLPVLGLAGTGHSQTPVQVQGTIQTVDCDALSVTLTAPDGSTVNTVYAAPDTAIVINSMSVPFCTLTGYIGAPATVWLLPSGDRFFATQINVIGPVAVAPPPTVAEDVTPVPICGTALGIVLVGGLLYLIVQGLDQEYYRYPYYGWYYRYYYRPEYRPYAGYWPATAVIITVAPPITGVVLGTVLIGGLQYVLCQDGAGHLSRYPYYGPYHQFYYRPAFHEYTGPYITSGAYRNAPVRQGEAQWDAPAEKIRRAPGGPGPSRPGTAPAYEPRPQGPQAPAYIPLPQRPQEPPAYEPRPVEPHAPANEPQHPPAPTYQAPPHPSAPSNQPAPQRPSTPTYQPPPRSSCGGPGQPPCPR